MENVRINEKSDGVKIKGHRGTWYCIGSRMYPVGQLFLMEHETYGEDAPHVIVDKRGNIVMEDVYNGFSDLDEEWEQF